MKLCIVLFIFIVVVIVVLFKNRIIDFFNGQVKQD